MSDTGSREDEVTLVGVVRGAGRLIRATLHVGSEVHVFEEGERLALELDDGARITVHAKPVSVSVHPVEKHHGRWERVAGSPAGILFANVAPGDHIDVRLESWRIKPGARIVVRGLVTEHALVGGGMREGAAEQPGAVDARRIAIVDATHRDADARAIGVLDDADRNDDRGRDRARRQLEEEHRKADAQARAAAVREARTKLPPKPLKFEVPILLGVGMALVLAAIAAWDYRSPRGEVSCLGRVLLPSATVVLFLALSIPLSLPRFETTDAPQEHFGPRWGIFPSLCFLVCIVQCLLTALLLGMSGEIPGYAASLGFGYAAAVGLGFLVGAIVRNRRMLRFARLLLLRRGGWIEGRVDAPGTVAERTVKYVDVNGVAIRGEPSCSNVKPFHVRTATGSVEIVAEHPLWGATLEYLPVFNEFGRPRVRFHTRAAIEPGDSILVCGRTSRVGKKPVIRETGPESVLFFAARQDARRTLARMVAGWLGLAALLAALIAANVWLAIVSWRMNAT